MSNMLKAGRPSATKKATSLTDLAGKGKTVRVNFDLSREEHIKLKIHAAKNGRRVADILREAIAKIE